MPELPEVETIRREIVADGFLDRTLLRCEVGKVGFARPKEKLHRFVAPPSRLREPLTEANRHGKFLFLTFPSGHIVCHFGMSGRLAVDDPQSADSAYRRFRFSFEGGRTLDFIDVRRFGNVDWFAGSEFRAYPRLAHYGPDALLDDVSPTHFLSHARHRRTPVKSLLMDQRVVAGLGNIYANELLFASRLHPLTPSHEVSRPAWRRLARNLKALLLDAIEGGGATLRDGVFLGLHGQEGAYRRMCNVYGRAGKACRRCGNVLLAATVGGRQTVYCSRCQRGSLSLRRAAADASEKALA
ncbi:MAG: bifunctional DNA-formamidopyrimidine glycosylase/DNA-(apurinic or apyrimidinic site) lyase [Pseudomonadales bacterium]|nr:bifunctional DNA-formamidopyrimidine glycosylase/DNA-(apurinic or apyrimidinic site) lyase [Pseudomonadales bacterium]